MQCSARTSPRGRVSHILAGSRTWGTHENRDYRLPETLPPPNFRPGRTISIWLTTGEFSRIVGAGSVPRQDEYRVRARMDIHTRVHTCIHSCTCMYFPGATNALVPEHARNGENRFFLARARLKFTCSSRACMCERAITA